MTLTRWFGQAPMQRTSLHAFVALPQTDFVRGNISMRLQLHVHFQATRIRLGNKKRHTYTRIPTDRAPSLHPFLLRERTLVVTLSTVFDRALRDHFDALRSLA